MSKLVLCTSEGMTEFGDEFKEALALPGGVVQVTGRDDKPLTGVTGEIVFASGTLRVTVVNAGDRLVEEPIKRVAKYPDGSVSGRYADSEKWKQAPFTGGEIRRVEKW